MYKKVGKIQQKTKKITKKGKRATKSKKEKYFNFIVKLNKNLQKAK